jgi:hypothetical protein
MNINGRKTELEALKAEVLRLTENMSRRDQREVLQYLRARRHLRERKGISIGIKTNQIRVVLIAVIATLVVMLFFAFK